MTKMTITRGKVHKYLKMSIEQYFTGKVIFLMVGYIGNIIDYITKDIKGESATPYSHHLLDIV